MLQLPSASVGCTSAWLVSGFGYRLRLWVRLALLVVWWCLGVWVIWSFGFLAGLRSGCILSGDFLSVFGYFVLLWRVCGV